MISQLMTRVEVPGGLVGDDDPRVVDERAGDRGPLLLAARELRRELAACAGQADEGEHAVDGRPDLAARRPGDLERERHVLPDRLASAAA